MSEVFDPEKIERFERGNPEYPDQTVVDAADCDKLLALYREACGLNTPQGQYLQSLKQ